MGVNYGMKKYWYVIVLVASIVLISSYVVQIPFPPEPPSNLEAEALSSTEIKLTWQDNSDSEEGFEIERKTEVEEWNLIKTVEADITEYTDSGLSTSTTYYYRIRSYNTKGYSNYFNTASAVTLSPSSTIKVWQKTYGGIYNDIARSVQQTEDGGYIVAGYIYSFGARDFDFYVIKLDSNGNEEWEKTYGGIYNEEAYSIQQTKDGGYIVAGYTYMEDTASFGEVWADFYVIKLDSNGNKEWEKIYGGSEGEEAYSIQQTKDGGYIVAGKKWPFGIGGSDSYVIKLDSIGNKEWEKTVSGLNTAYSVQQTEDGGYIVAGYYSAGEDDPYVIKLDSIGNKEWEKIYGGSEAEKVYSIRQTEDGGYIAAGYTYGAGEDDSYAIKLDSNGNKEWEKTYNGGYVEKVYSIWQTEDGGYIAAGKTDSFGTGEYDFYLVKTDAEGNTTANP